MKQLFPEIETTGSTGLWSQEKGNKWGRTLWSLRFLPRSKFSSMTWVGATWLDAALKKKAPKDIFRDKWESLFFLSLYWIYYNIASVFMFWFFGREACGILPPWPGIEPAPTALEGDVLTTGPPRESRGSLNMNWKLDGISELLLTFLIVIIDLWLCWKCP